MTHRKSTSRSTARVPLPPPSAAPTTRDELMDALLIERFGTPTPEWHPTPDPAVAYREYRDARALRLVADNTEAAG